MWSRGDTETDECRPHSAWCACPACCVSAALQEHALTSPRCAVRVHRCSATAADAMRTAAAAAEHLLRLSLSSALASPFGPHAPDPSRHSTLPHSSSNSCPPAQLLQGGVAPPRLAAMLRAQTQKQNKSLDTTTACLHICCICRCAAAAAGGYAGRIRCTRRGRPQALLAAHPLGGHRGWPRRG